MKIAIIGLGGVGGYFGGKLARRYANNKDVDITFIARGKHLEKIQNNGLKVITEQGTFIAKPDKAIDNPASCGIFDLIVFCVKSYDLEDSAKFQKVNLSHDIFQKSLDKIALFPSETKSSLQMDFEKKKNTELDIFAGYIVRYAKEHGIDVPLHEKVYNVLSRKAK